KWFLDARKQNDRITFRFSQPTENGKISYMGVQDDKTISCHASESKACEWIPFINEQTNKWAFRQVDGDYLSSQEDQPLIANQSCIGDSEQFTISGDWDKTILDSLLTIDNQRLVEEKRYLSEP